MPKHSGTTRDECPSRPGTLQLLLHDPASFSTRSTGTTCESAIGTTPGRIHQAERPQPQEAAVATRDRQRLSRRQRRRWPLQLRANRSCFDRLHCFYDAKRRVSAFFSISNRTSCTSDPALARRAIRSIPTNLVQPIPPHVSDVFEACSPASQEKHVPPCYTIGTRVLAITVGDKTLQRLPGPHLVAVIRCFVPPRPNTLQLLGPLGSSPRAIVSKMW